MKNPMAQVHYETFCSTRLEEFRRFSVKEPRLSEIQWLAKKLLPVRLY